MWERGLKRALHGRQSAAEESLPMWERGLKHPDGKVEEGRDVAPHVGAWIETICSPCSCPKNMSLPMWERGLKLLDD